ncbi:SH3 domain-containing kinase-binding protein 1-like [Temnothorax curvispinosus]|uniref:Ras-related protein Rab-1 n=2 Tax=Temnothorax TaxID=300110 RepID=A0A6J1Q9Y7_9HYME|nr:SH3 domain-containing kinase-binding protein 1-like [Temnothorax curvispinosus]
MALDFAATYKVLVLGDSNVGKTCIVHRYCDERYYDTYISTIGIDFKQKIINLDGTPIKLQIWDTAGQERFRTLTTAYYRGAMGILLMYDVTSLESFNHLSYWLRNIQENASPDVVKVLAANKCDATANRAVEAERGQKIAENFDMPFFEVSCKENINIEEAFLTLARRIREQRGRRASLFEASEREGADSIIKAQSPSQQGDAWRMEAIVEYNYVAQEDDELTLRKGDIITGIKMMLGGWWEGTLRDKRGMFPDNFVKVLDSSSTASGNNGSETVSSTKSDENVTLRNGSGRRFCKVLFSYEPCNEDELTLVPQDSIEFLGEVEEGWWRGRLRGRVGVFPSNFVSAPAPEEQERHKERDKKEICRVLFPYEAANEDELTLVEGDIITLFSKDALDKGWWKGELRGQVGLFPDNFVEVIGIKNESQEQDSQWHETSSLSAKSTIRHSHQVKKVEKAHVRKSLDTRNVHSSNISDHFPTLDAAKKGLSTLSSTSTSSLTSTGSGNSDKKTAGSHSIISSLKRFVSDVGNNNGISNTTSTASECREELDGVERGEGTPLSHLTASRAKAPRRRPPSSQHLRHAAGSNASASSTLPTVPNTLLEDNLSNGRTDGTTLEQIPDEETDGLAAKARRKAPWVEELKMNQMERRKTATVERVDKVEVKKERNFSRLMTQGNTADSTNKQDTDNDDSKPKDKSPRAETSPHADQSPSSSGQPAYVPYALYSKLLERVAALEEKQAVLQATIGQLSEQLVPLLANASVNSKV